MNHPKYRCIIQSSDVRHVARSFLQPSRFTGKSFGFATLVLWLFGGILAGQPMLINSGGPSVAGFAADAFCPTVTRWTPATPGYDAAIGSGIWADLIYGTSFSCDVSLPNGNYRLVLDLEENRGSSGKSGPVGPGTRVFSITANGTSTGALDLFQLAGPQIPYQKSLAVQVTTGHLIISATATTGNAVLSAFEVYPVSPPLGPGDTITGLEAVLADGSKRTVPLGAQLQIVNQSLTVSFILPQLADLRTCSGGSPGSDCTGLVYLQTTDGKQYLAVTPPAGFTLNAHWTKP